MKKVLILAYDFEPLNSIGAQRPLSWFKYFKQFGIHPVVVTRHWDAIKEPSDLVRPSIKQVVEIEENAYGTIVRVPFQPNLRDRILLQHGLDKKVMLRKVLSLAYSIGQYFWMRSDNRSNLYREAKKQLEQNDFSAIIATGEPFVLFKYAQLLSEQFNVPWVADYRDGWSKNYAAFHAGEGLQNWLNEHVFTRIEKQIVATASICTFTVESHQQEVASLLPDLRTEIVMNGYFEELFESLPPANNGTKPYTIAYSGTIYPYQELELFLEGFQHAITSRRLGPEDIQLVFYGLEYQSEQLVRLLSYSNELIPFIRTTDRMAMNEVIGELNKANALLLLASPTREQVYAKVFDYIALQKPIILCPSDNGTLARIVSNSPRPLITNSASDVSVTIIDLFDNPHVNTDGSKVSEKYSRRNQAKRMAEIVNEL